MAIRNTSGRPTNFNSSHVTSHEPHFHSRLAGWPAPDGTDPPLIDCIDRIMHL